ncbi:EAL domain-containing protein [Paenibacillus sp. IB182363]|uniref:EAL domain-containing protein n=2 Tax=Paenibacillus oceani TaxID=2772510 RepID=A0A927C861_9BACL|nr:EAL domain-containing protein [Paenibacillus oceani]
MQKIPVTRDGKRGSDIITIPSSDIVKIDKIRNRDYVVHTKTDQFYLDLSLESIEEWLFEDGFRLIDTTNVVNMNHVVEYDSKKGTVYFDHRSAQESKVASAARIHKEHVENMMEMLRLAKLSKAEEGLRDNSFEERMRDIAESHDDDRFVRSYSTIRAVVEREKAERKIRHMAYHDALTDLPNRLLFHERLNEAFHRSEKTGTILAVLFIDLDRIKVINDTLGHHIGDELLKYWADKLKANKRPQDTVARFGGDEFIVLLTDITSINEVLTFASFIPQLFSEPFTYGEHDLYVTSSIGISVYPSDGTDADTLIKNADTAMYRAKEKGGNTFQLYRSEMNIRSLERLNMEIDLRRAMERGEIMVYYQPIVDLGSGRIYGMEALVRWKHPIRGMISPAEFIPLAEETGLIVPIGNWVLKEACRQNEEWISQGLPPLVVAVNISVNQFQQPGFIQLIKGTLESTGLDPKLLCLEITENVAMKNVNYIVETIDKLRELGVRISIDDFGTGYSSLSYLKRFRVHTLKIDQSFIQELTTDEENAAIVTALIAMSHKMNIKALAEGVETKAQLEFLRRYGCDEIQGYLFSTPLPVSDFEHLIRVNRNLSEVLR